MPVNKLFDYPYSSFLMLRREFEIFCQEQDLEVKVLRVIEMYVENERTRLFQLQANRSKTPIDKIEIPRDVWVPITYNLFRSEIYDEKISDNTLKAAIKSLEAKKLIQKQYAPKKRYDPPTYRLQVHVIDILNAFLRVSGGQKLIPSKIDTLKNLPPQFLTPSFLSTIEDLRVSKIDTNSNKGNVYEERVCSNQSQGDTDPQPNITHTPLSDDVAPDYTTSPTIEQLSTATEQNVDKSPNENGSHSQQSYSHRQDTSPATHVGVMPVFEVPLPPGAKIPDAPQPPKGVRQQQPPAPTEIYTLEARTIRKLYDSVHGIATGHPEWEWKKMEDMAASGVVPTREDMQLVYDHLKAKKQKHTIVHVWENWKLLPSLKKPVMQEEKPRKAFSPSQIDHHSDPWAV